MGVRILLHSFFRQGSNEKSPRLLLLVLLGSPLPKSSPFSFTNCDILGVGEQESTPCLMQGDLLVQFLASFALCCVLG